MNEVNIELAYWNWSWIMFHNMENYRLYFNQPTVEANLLNECFTMDNKINL